MKDQTDRRVFNGYGNNAITLVQTECSLIVRMTASEKLGNTLFDRNIVQTQYLELEFSFPFFETA